MSKVRITNKLIINSVVGVIYQIFASMRKNTVLWNRQNANNVKIVFVTQK